MSKRIGGLALAAVMTVLVGLNFSAEGQDKKGPPVKAPAAGLTFEVYKDKGGEFRYRILDEKGANLGGSGKGYDKVDDVLKIVDTIKKGAASAKVLDQSGKK